MQIVKPTVSIVLDKRRKKKATGLFPAKLRVYYPKTKKSKLYSTIFDFSEKDFAAIWETSKTRAAHKEDKKKLKALISAAETEIDSLQFFTFEQFEKNMYGNNSADYNNIVSIFDILIAEKLESESYSTMEKFEQAKKCLQNFWSYHTKGQFQKPPYKKPLPSTIDVINIDIKFLKKFQLFCEKKLGHKTATISINLRNIRTAMNVALKEGSIVKEQYPFGIEKFVIPKSSKVNKALTLEQIKLLKDAKPQNSQQQKAKDYWFFSYHAFGLNLKDIIEIKHSSIQGDVFTFLRAKTRTTKKDLTPKVIPITKTLRDIMERQKVESSEYLFGILEATDTAERMHIKRKNFTKYVNNNFRAFAKSAGIDDDFTIELASYHARHSMITNALEKGAGIGIISDVMHDGNIAETQRYIKTFPEERRKALGELLE